MGVEKMDIGNLNDTKNSEQNQINTIPENETLTSNIPEAQISVSENCNQINSIKNPLNENTTTDAEGDENRTSDKVEQNELLKESDSQNENMKVNQNFQKKSSPKRKKPDPVILSCVLAMISIAIIGAVLIWHTEALRAKVTHPDEQTFLEKTDPLKNVLDQYSSSENKNYIPISKTKKSKNFKESNKKEEKKSFSLSYLDHSISFSVPDDYISTYAITYGDGESMRYFSDNEKTNEVMCSYGPLSENATPESIIKMAGADRPDISINKDVIDGREVWYYFRHSDDNKNTEFFGVMEYEGNQYSVAVTLTDTEKGSLSFEEITKFFKLTVDEEKTPAKKTTKG